MYWNDPVKVIYQSIQFACDIYISKRAQKCSRISEHVGTLFKNSTTGKRSSISLPAATALCIQKRLVNYQALQLIYLQCDLV